MSEAAPAPFAGTRVADLAIAPRARIAARILAQHGALVQRPGRAPGEPWLDAGKSPVAEGDAIALARSCEIVILCGEALARHAIDPLELHRERPGTIIAVATAFGLTWHEPSAPTSDAMLQALTGAAWLARTGTGKPRLRGLAFAEGIVASQMVLAIGAALIRKRRSGAGALIDLSALDALASMDTAYLPGVWRGRAPVRCLPVADDRSPVDTTAVYRGVRRRIIVNGFAHYWPRLAESIGRPDLATAEGFATDEERVRQWDTIIAAVEGWLAAVGDDREAVLHLVRSGVPASLVLPADEALSHPQLAARGFAAQEDAAGRTLPAPVLFDGARCSPGVPPQSAPPSPALHSATPPVGAGTRPLEGIRVLDLTAMTAGALATRMLADLGAEVWKIEPPEGELGRMMDGFTRSPADSYLSYQSAGKKGVAIDLATAEGRALLRRLALEADTVVENFTPGVLERMGIGAASLRSERPDLVVCSISGFGQTGPFSPARTFDSSISVASGIFASYPSEHGGAMEPFALCDTTSAFAAAGAIVAALHRRLVTGAGATLDVSMLEAVLAAQDGYFWQSEGSPVPGPGAILAGTGDMAIAVDLAAAGARAALAAFAGCDGNAADELLEERLAARIAAEGRDSVLAGLRLGGLVAEPVLRPWELLEEPRFAARNGLDLPPTGQAITPFRHCGFAIPAAPPPRIGEHSRAVLAAAGLPEAEIAALVSRGVVIAGD